MPLFGTFHCKVESQSIVDCEVFFLTWQCMTTNLPKVYHTLYNIIYNTPTPPPPLPLPSPPPLSASEGKTVQVEYRGDVRETVQDILGGVRSTCTYVGAQKLKELSRRTTFIRVTQQINNIFQ